jgi:uncharacterized glyoxalase superfamily protein PhnB
MQLTSFYPVLNTTKLVETTAFYVEHFGFSITFESDWYVSLRHGQATHYELALMNFNHASIPSHKQQTLAGLLLNFEVEDVDAEYARLIHGAGLPVLHDIRSEAWGQRHFMTMDPNGVMIDVITNIPPSGEYAEQYLEPTAPDQGSGIGDRGSGAQ